METEKNSKLKDDSVVEAAVLKICDIILTEKDEINEDEVINYLEMLDDAKIKLLNENDINSKIQVDAIVTQRVKAYIQIFEPELENSKYKAKDPFEFVSGGNYTNLCSKIEQIFKEKHKEELPLIISFTLDYIQEISKSYRMFKSFYDVRSKQTASKVIEEMKISARNMTEEEINKTVNKFSKKVNKKLIRR